MRAGPGGGYDALDTVKASRAGRRNLRRVPHLMRSALQLSYRAGRGTLVLTVVLQLLGAVLAGLQVLLVGRALRAVLDADRDGTGLGRALLPLGLFVVVGAVATTSSTLLGQRNRLLGELVSRHVWRGVLSVTSRVPLISYEDTAFYDRVQRVQTHALTRPLSMVQGLVSLVGGVVGIVVVGVALVAIEPLVVPVLLFGGLPLVWLSRRGSRLEWAFSVDQVPALRARGYLRRVLLDRAEAGEVRAFDLADLLSTRHEDNYRDYLTALRVHLRARARLIYASTAVSSLVTVLALTVLLLAVDAGRVSIAGAGAAVLAVRLLATRVQLTANGLSQLFESSLFLSDLQDFLAGAPATPATDGGTVEPFEVLEAQGVGFTYPGATRPALDGVDLSLRRGEVVAIVGENGSGKSTLAKVVCGLYAPGQGRLLWDGTDVAELDPAAVRAQVAPVFQDFVRFELSALHNVGIGRADRVDDLTGVREAAADAGADHFLCDLSRGYDTMLSTAFGGTDLSGGQWQRVALARAFFRDAPLLVLDEPSASLDPRAEHALFASLRALFRGRTVLFVSHRFSTVRTADRIVVMHAGKVVQQGGHDELMTQDGPYAELFTLQADALLTDDRS